MTYVIIPAYNEEDTIRAVTGKFLADPRTFVVVIIDRLTKDATAVQARRDHPRLFVVMSSYHGKGQNISLALPEVRGQEVILCDADVTLSNTVVPVLMEPLGRQTGQRIVVPRPPTEQQWRATEATTFPVKFDRSSWPWVSGIRRVRVKLIPDTIYGYLTEVLINRAVAGSDTPYTKFWYDNDVISPLRFSQERINDLHAHGRYGREKGLIP